MTSSGTDNPFAQAKAHFLAGLQAHQAGDDAGAERSYLASLALMPGRVSTLTNLAASQLRLGRAQDALQSATQALAMDADDIDARLHHGVALAQLARNDEALRDFDRMLAQDPRHPLAWSHRGSLLREMQRFEEAAEAFRQALRLGADETLHRYYLAAVESTHTPPVAPSAYVRNLFDAYAGDFDRHLVDELQYRAPQQLIQSLPRWHEGSFVAALDLGCGTGLCAPLLRPLTQHLTGLDLSARMLAIAAGLNLYDAVEHADLGDYLHRTSARFDLVVAADVLIYLGDLTPLFTGVRRVMQHGIFCFSVETDQPSDADYSLRPSLRYAHSVSYLRRMAAAHGFTVLAMQAGTVREEHQHVVPGLYVYLRA